MAEVAAGTAELGAGAQARGGAAALVRAAGVPLPLQAAVVPAALHTRLAALPGAADLEDRERCPVTVISHPLDKALPSIHPSRRAFPSEAKKARGVASSSRKDTSQYVEPLELEADRLRGNFTPDCSAMRTLPESGDEG